MLGGIIINGLIPIYDTSKYLPSTKAASKFFNAKPKIAERWEEEKCFEYFVLILIE